MSTSSALQLTNDLIRQALHKCGYGRPADGELHILGVRGATPCGTATIVSQTNAPDRYNDAVVLFGTALKAYRGTVDPGDYYTQKPLHPEGAAHILNGGPYTYKLGHHRGHRALVQAGTVKYWRDANKNHVRDNTPLEQNVREGMIGLNIHAGGTGELIGPNSAACLNIQGGWTGQPWLNFYNQCEASGQQFFKLWVLDFQDLVK